MKDKKMRLLLACSAVFQAACLVGHAQSMELFIQPDIRSQKMATTSLDDPRLGQPAPVMDEAKAALGWHYAEFSDTVRAYVQDAKIGKDLLPVDNAILYARPEADSPVLGTYRDGSDIEVIDTGAWWSLEVATAFPVYFVMDTPPPLPPVTGTAEEESIVELQDTPSSGPALATTESAPMPIYEGGSTTTDPVRPIMEFPKPPSQPDVLGQSYEGKFRKAKKVLGLFAPKETFYLESSRGKRIAWVDTSKIVIPGSLKDFLEQPVIIYGERDYRSSSKDWIIRARNMRLK